MLTSMLSAPIAVCSLDNRGGVQFSATAYTAYERAQHNVHVNNDVQRCSKCAIPDPEVQSLIA